MVALDPASEFCIFLRFSLQQLGLVPTGTGGGNVERFLPILKWMCPVTMRLFAFIFCCFLLTVLSVSDPNIFAVPNTAFGNLFAGITLNLKLESLPWKRSVK